MDSIAGCVIPIAILTCFELYSKFKGKTTEGYIQMKKAIDPDANLEPSEKMKRATKEYSFMALNIFCITIGFIALMLFGLLLIGDAKTVAVSGIVIAFACSILTICVIYIIYRIIDKRKNNS